MMRKLLRFLLPVALLGVAASAQTSSSPPATAATAAPAFSRVGIISIQQAIVATNEGRRDLEALQKKFEPTQNELNALNKEIDDLKKQLQTQGDKLNDEARANMVKNIDTKEKTLRRRVEDAQGDFQSQQNDIANRIGGKLLEVLDKYAKQNGYAVILDVSSQQSPVLWAAATTDVTKDIVDAYNAQSGVPAPATTPSAPSATRPAPKPATPGATAPKPPATKQ